MSAKLASTLGLSKVAATDTIREVLRTQLTTSESPALHRSSFEPAGGSAAKDWMDTVGALSEGVVAVVERSCNKGVDLLLEGVHYLPNTEVIDHWREAGGVATGVVLYVTSEERHRGMIARREKHNGKQIDHYLSNLGRIREIQEELVSAGNEAGWLLIDATRESAAVEIIAGSLS